MSEENKTTQTEGTKTKKTGIFGWVKNIVSAIIGAAISFGVTIGVVSADQEKQLNEKMTSINIKAEEVVSTLKSGDVNGAIVKAQEIANETKVVTETAKEIVSETKEKVTEKAEEIKQVAEKAKEDISKAVKDKPTK